MNTILELRDRLRKRDIKKPTYEILSRNLDKVETKV
jgi:hypothetical protein